MVTLSVCMRTPDVREPACFAQCQLVMTPINRLLNRAIVRYRSGGASGRFVVVVGACAEGVEAAFESEAGAVDGEHFGVVEEAVEDRGGEGFVAEGLGPFGDGLVAGDDRGAAGVAAVDDLK